MIEIAAFAMAAPDENGEIILAAATNPPKLVCSYDIVVSKPDFETGDIEILEEFDDLTLAEASQIADELEAKYPESGCEWI